MHAKVDWAEHDEKESSFFFNRIKHNDDRKGRLITEGNQLVEMLPRGKDPYLFIIGLGPLLRHIISSEVMGLATPRDRVKLTAYADDLTLFAKDQRDKEVHAQ